MPLAITRSQSFTQSSAAICDQAVRRSQSRNATGTAALLGLLAIGGLFAFLDLEDETAPLMSPLALAVICMAVGLVPAAVAAMTRPRFDIFEPIHLVIAAFTLITAVRALYLIGYGTAVYPRVPPDALLSAALALSIAGILSVYTGYYSGIGDNLVASMRPWKPLWIGELGYPPATIAIAAAIGLAAMIVLGGESYGVEGQRSVLDDAGLFWLVPLSSCAPFALYMMLLNFERQPASAARLSAFFSMLGLIVAFFLLRPSKIWLLRLAIYPLVFYHYRHRKLPPLRTAVIGGVVVTGLFVCTVIAHVYVRAFAFDSAETLRYLGNRLRDPRDLFDMVLSRFYGIDSISVIILHVRHTGQFLMGASLAEVFYWFVPRAVWPGKPYTFSYAFGRMFQSYMGWGGEAYASTTLFGELYLNFGIIGVVGGSFLFGLLARCVYAYLIGRVRTKSAVMLYSIILVQAVEFTEGPIGAHVALSTSEVAPFLMLLYLTWAATSFGRRAPVMRGRL